MKRQRKASFLVGTIVLVLVLVLVLALVLVFVLVLALVFVLVLILLFVLALVFVPPRTISTSTSTSASASTSTSMVVDPKRRDSSTIPLFFAFLSLSSLFQTSLHLGASLGFWVDGFALSARSP